MILSSGFAADGPSGPLDKGPLETLRERSAEQRWAQVRAADAELKTSRQEVITNEAGASTLVSGPTATGTMPAALPEAKSSAPDMPASISDAAPTASSKSVVALPTKSASKDETANAAATPPAFPFLDHPEVLVEGEHEWVLPSPGATQVVAATMQPPVPAAPASPTPLEPTVAAPTVAPQVTQPTTVEPPLPPLPRESERAVIADERLAVALPNLGIRRIYQIVPFGDPAQDQDIRNYAVEQQTAVGLHIDNSPVPPRDYPGLLAQWEPPNLYHQPLYFEDVALERYGHHYPPGIQSAVSLGRFGVQLVGFPYQAVIHPPTSHQYALGNYRPGECAPKLTYQIPWNAKAAAVQAGAVVGFIYMIP
jgi:hypothetical protein